MWGTFVLAVFVAITLMYVPGYLFWRGMGFMRLISICCAPLFSIAVYSLLPIAYYELDVACNLLTVAAPAFLLGAACFAVFRARGKDGDNGIALRPLAPVRICGRSCDFDHVCACLALFIGLVVCACLFVGNLPEPSTFFSRFDNQTHLNLPQAFLESGRWSTVHTSVFLASPIAQTPFNSNTGVFYPATWHVCVALVCLGANTVVTVASNALVFVVCGIAFPLDLYLFVRVLLRNNRRAIALGTLLISSSAVLPWVYLLKGPTYPEMLSHSLVPAALAVVVLCVQGKVVRSHGLAFAIFCLTSFVGLAIMHPNSIFTCYVFLAAFGMHMLWAWTGERRPILRVAIVLLYCAVLVGVWVGCYSLPPLQGVLGYRWKTVEPVFSSIGSLGTLSLTIGREQPLLMLVVLVGGVTCLKRKWLWVLFPPLYFAACFMVCRLGWEDAKYWLAALWYMTPYRFASKIIIFSLPIMALGLERVAHAIQRLVLAKAPGAIRAHARAVCLAALALLLVYNYLPRTFYDNSSLYAEPQPGEERHPYEASFGRVWRRLHEIYANDIEHVYSEEEVAFVNRALELVPQDSLVVNSPNDGSMWAYGVNDLKTYYRNRQYGNDTPESQLLRTNLASYANDAAVQEAVRKTGAAYVLQLDHGVPYAEGVWIPQYGEGQVGAWAGIEAIDQSTPGFELVLSEGSEMRLYRITEL